MTISVLVRNDDNRPAATIEVVTVNNHNEPTAPATTLHSQEQREFLVYSGQNLVVREKSNG